MFDKAYGQFSASWWHFLTSTRHDNICNSTRKSYENTITDCIGFFINRMCQRG